MALYVLACGLSPCGLESPTIYEPLPAAPAIAAEDYDPETRELRSLTASADPIDAQVQLALTAVRESSAILADTGQTFGDIKKLGTDAELLIEKATRDALARLVRNRDIDIDSVSVLIGDDWAEVTVVYYNRRSARNAGRLRSYTRRI